MVILAWLSLYVQLLLVGKVLASYLSGSLSVVTSAVDSFIDLVSGSIMLATNRAIAHRDPYLYPEGVHNEH